MSETYYKIKRTEGKAATTWIGSYPLSRVFDSGQDTFIVSERELGVCIHNGNFDLVGPAPAGEIPSQPVSPPKPTPEPTPKPSESESEEED